MPQKKTNMRVFASTLFLLGVALQVLTAQADRDSIAWAMGFDDVVVTAQYAPTDSRNALHDLYTIRQTEIAQRAALNLEQLLRQEVNIRIRQDLVLGSSVSLLGVDGQNVKIMVDGVPVIGRQNGNINLGQLNLHHIERVEIVEGPLSVSYGTDALGGVINLITKKSQLQRYELGVSHQVESRSEDRYLGKLGVKLSEALSLRLNGGQVRFDGFSPEPEQRSVLWNPKDQWFADAYLGWRFGEQRDKHLYYTGSYFDEEVVNLGNVRRPQFRPYAFDDYYLTQRLSHALAYEGPVGRQWYLQGTAAYNRFDRLKRSLRTNFEDDIQEEVFGQQDTSAFTGVMLRAALASQFNDRKLNFQVGIDLRYDDALGQRIQDSTSSRPGFSQIGDYAAFGSLRYQPMAGFTLEGGLRYAYNTRYAAPLVPSLHLKYTLSPTWALRASYSQGFRSPDIKELFFNFIDINHFIVGNPSLAAERSDNLQLSLSFRQPAGPPRLGFKLKLFYNHIRDKIELFEFVEGAGGIQPAVDTSTLRFAYFNQAVYKAQGGSLGFDYAANGLELNSNLSVIGYYNPASERFAEVLPFTYALELSNSIAYELPGKGLRLALFLRNNDKLVTFFPSVGQDGETFAAQRLQEGFAMVDFTLVQRFWHGRLSLTAGVRNLLDIQRAAVSGAAGGGAHSGGTGAAPVSPGRSFLLQAAVDLGWGR
jgi:outer membrane receptor for ferrienterochelin and colicins